MTKESAPDTNRRPRNRWMHAPLIAALAAAAACSDGGSTGDVAEQAPANAEPQAAAREPVPGAAPSAGDASSAPVDEALLESSAPADGGIVTGSPASLTLNFAQPVRLGGLTVVGDGGQTVPVMVAAAGALETFTIRLPTLQPDRYTATWRALAAGGATAEGQIRFTVH